MMSRIVVFGVVLRWPREADTMINYLLVEIIRSVITRRSDNSIHAVIVMKATVMVLVLQACDN
ncbi:MAG: hypothetical protein A4E19_04220 [Nitrospira sp. SG-bin1]|nr:MAG: hypothetical protein A4E19_04220 [Nitrospira sp. SG-bin1]